MSKITADIKGYRQLSEAEQVEINKLKDDAEYTRRRLESLTNVDERWLAIARTHLQQGYMAAIRAIAKPETF